MAKYTDIPYKVDMNKKNRKYATKEEAYEAHKERVKRWQRENPDKHGKNVDKYHRKPEIIQKDKDRYANMDPVKKEIMLEKQRVRNKARYLEKK